MNAIYPVERTYLTLVPLELRELLYLYVNTVAMENVIKDAVELVYAFIYLTDIEGVRFIIVFNKRYMRSNERLNDMSKFINFLKIKMTYKYQNYGWTGVNVDITSLTLLVHHIDYTIGLQSHELMSKMDILTTCSLPVCITLVEVLEKTYDMLKKE